MSRSKETENLFTSKIKNKSGRSKGVVTEHEGEDEIDDQTDDIREIDISDHIEEVNDEAEDSNDNEFTTSYPDIQKGSIDFALEDDNTEMTLREHIARKNRKNVILLLADDMRPQLGAYLGEDHPTPLDQKLTITPNFDRLAGESIVFTRAYVQYSLCGPSRTSILTSRRPDTTRVFGNMHYWRTTGGNFTTIPQYFKDNGYTTIGVGKVFHPSVSSNHSDPISWSEKFYSRYWDGTYEHKSRLPSWNAITDQQRAKVPLTDEFAVKHALERLRVHAKNAKRGKKPLFMSLGFRKPHISLNCPKKYFKLYPLETAEAFLGNKSWQNPIVGFKLVNSTIKNGINQIPDGELRRLRRAYFACISYVDDLLGEVLDEVDKLGLASNTIIAFMADHGYHLGENNHWGKYINYEIANHVPMMIKIPGKTDSGIRTRSLVEGVDLFPTLAEAAGVGAIPACPRGSSSTQLCTDGLSLMPLVKKPKKVLKTSTLSQVLRGDRYMEYTLRTNRFRYTTFADVRHKKHRNGTYTVNMDWNRSGMSDELFDHSVDPEERYNKVAEQKYQNIVLDLHETLVDKVGTIYNVPVKIPSRS